MRRGGMDRRIARLEELASPEGLAEELPGWPLDAELAAALDHLDFHVTFGTVAACTDRELCLLGAVDGLPEGWRGHVRRIAPARQEERDRREYENRRDFEPWRERVRRRAEEQRAFAERSRQRDHELLERNRASVGLPPLSPEQIADWGLEGARWEGET